MLELNFDKELGLTKEEKQYLGMMNIPMDEYREVDALANSDLQIFNKNPSSYIWNKTAPSDSDKATSADFGTALHTKLLEPELFDDSILISSTKGRTAQAFIDMQRANPDKIVLTDQEVHQIDLMAKSANADPMFRKALSVDGQCEHSIFVEDKELGVKMKIRPDKIIAGKEHPVFCDVKSSASIEEWRADKQWINPLFDKGYGFTAAYYMYVGSLFFGIEMTKYVFLVVSKSAMLGKYPVSTFMITKDELVEYGFWDEMIDALHKFSEHKKSNNWLTFEHFPAFRIFNEESIDVKFVE